MMNCQNDATCCFGKMLWYANCLGQWLPHLAFRVFLCYEFFSAGLKKFNGYNWFSEIQENFPFPFNVIHPNISWFMATSVELIAPILLLVGLATRISAVLLSGLTLVAWSAVHSGLGYNVCDNGYKMALIFLLCLLPLITQGAGKLSLDCLISKRCGHKSS